MSGSFTSFGGCRLDLSLSSQERVNLTINEPRWMLLKFLACLCVVFNTCWSAPSRIRRDRAFCRAMKEDPRPPISSLLLDVVSA